jgi:hypothetical protein
MPETSLNKRLARFMEGGEVTRKAEEFLSTIYSADPDTWKTMLVNTVKLYGLSGLTFFVKEANAELTDDQAASVAREVIRRVTGQAGASWIGSEGDFNDMLAQVRQPRGGTENMSNVASPGQPPGKVSAQPGKSGDYGRSGKTVPPESGYYDSTGQYSGTGHYGGYRQAPGAFVAGEGEGHEVQHTDGPQRPLSDFQGSSDNPHSRAHLSHGPVGTAGVTDVVSVKPGQTKPGNVHPKYTSTEIGYSKTGFGKFSKPVAKQVGTPDTFLASGQAPNILESISKSRDPTKFEVNQDALHIPPGYLSKYMHQDGVIEPKNTIAKSEHITKGIIKRKREEDTRTSLAGTREGQAYAGTERQQAYHTEEDYGDTGDASQYPDGGSPFDDDPNAMSDLTLYDESKRQANESEAAYQDELARRDEDESKKYYRAGQYQFSETLKQSAIAHRELAYNLRKRLSKSLTL